MSSDKQRVVVDSCVLLDLFIADDQKRVADAQQIVKASERDLVEIMLPAIVVAEMAGAPSVRGDHIPPETRHDRIAKVRDWLLSSRFTLIEIDERVARRAADLCAPYQLKGADACILASAELWRVPDLYTTDPDLLKVGTEVPGVRVRMPSTFPIAPQEELDVDP